MTGTQEAHPQNRHGQPKPDTLLCLSAQWSSQKNLKYQERDTTAFSSAQTHGMPNAKHVWGYSAGMSLNCGILSGLPAAFIRVKTCIPYRVHVCPETMWLHCNVVPRSLLINMGVSLVLVETYHSWRATTLLNKMGFVNPGSTLLGTPILLIHRFHASNLSFKESLRNLRHKQALA